MAGMTGEMNIITGKHENVLLVPTRALLVDQALIVKHGVVQKRTVKIGFRTLDFSEIMSGLSLAIMSSSLIRIGCVPEKQCGSA